MCVTRLLPSLSETATVEPLIQVAGPFEMADKVTLTGA